MPIQLYMTSLDMCLQVDVEEPVSSEEEGDENLEIALKLIKQHNKREPRQYVSSSDLSALWLLLCR